MATRKNWASSQSLIIMAVILLIFVYIGIDMGQTKPRIKNDLKEVKKEYVELSTFLDKKVPEIDSTLRIQAKQISSQGEDINFLNDKLKDLGTETK